MKKIFLFLIILLVISLLAFSLLFIYKTFFSISGRQKCLGCDGLSPTRELFDGINDPVVLISNSMHIKQGASEDFAVGFKNIGKTEGTFSYRILVNSTPNNLKSVNWMPSGGDLGSLKVGGVITEVLAFDVPSDAIPGNYRFKIELSCSADGCGTGRTFPFTIRVQA